jgi:peroxiredoxin
MKKMMLGLFLFMSVQLLAQDSNRANVVTYKTLRSFPSFQLFALDSSKFYSTAVLEKNEPTVLIYFSPTCSHCQHQAEEITSHIKEFKGVKFLMVSSYSLQEIRQFSETYAIDKFPNIKLAHDANASLVKFYEIKSLPGIFVYDKKAKFKTLFPTNVKAGELLSALKN